MDKDEPNLLDREAAFNAGDVLALWDEIYESEVRSRPKPEWARRALIAYAKEVMRSIKSRTARGRKALAFEEQQQLWDDYVVFGTVNEWRAESWKPKRAKARQFSWRRSFIMAGRECHLSPEAIRTAYKRAEKRQKEGYYASELFLRTLRIEMPPLV